MRYYSRTAAGVKYLVKRGKITPGTYTGMIDGDVFAEFADIGNIGVFDTESIPLDEVVLSGSGKESDPLATRKMVQNWVDTQGKKGLFGPDFYHDGEPYLELKLRYGHDEVERMAREFRAVMVKE